jgi:hypothetical protein
MDEFYWLRLIVIYLLGLIAGLIFGLTSYFRHGLKWKKHSAALIILSFVWPIVLFLMCFSSLWDLEPLYESP